MGNDEQVRERGERKKSKESKHEFRRSTTLVASDALSLSSLPKYFMKLDGCGSEGGWITQLQHSKCNWTSLIWMALDPELALVLELDWRP